MFGGYPDLAYAKALRANALPPNIDVDEFFLLAGRFGGKQTETGRPCFGSSLAGSHRDPRCESVPVGTPSFIAARERTKIRFDLS